MADGQLIRHGGIDEVINQYTTDQEANDRIADSIHYYQPHLKVHSVQVNESESSSIVMEGGSANASDRARYRVYEADSIRARCSYKEG